MLADTIMKIHATSVIKDETIKIYYFALLFQLLNISVILKLYVFFFNEVFEDFTILQRTSKKTCLEARLGIVSV